MLNYEKQKLRKIFEIMCDRKMILPDSNNNLKRAFESMMDMGYDLIEDISAHEIVMTKLDDAKYQLRFNTITYLSEETKMDGAEMWGCAQSKQEILERFVQQSQDEIIDYEIKSLASEILNNAKKFNQEIEPVEKAKELNNIVLQSFRNNALARKPSQTPKTPVREKETTKELTK